MISFLIGILSGCSHTTSTHTIQKDLSKDQIIEINYDDVLKKINQKEDFVLYVGRPDCKDCQEFEPYLKKYLKKNKKRTLLTIIGIIISLSLISGVGFLGLSFNEYMYNRAIDNNGDYEFGFSNVDKDVVNILRNDVDLKNVGVFSNVGLGKYVLEDKDENSIYITEQDETYST